MYTHHMKSTLQESDVRMCFSTNIPRAHPYSTEMKRSHPVSNFHPISQLKYLKIRLKIHFFSGLRGSYHKQLEGFYTHHVKRTLYDTGVRHDAAARIFSGVLPYSA